MLINLCQNSADAMNGKGEIHISTFIEHKIFGHFFCLSVRDSGVGIPKEFEDRIYKPFFTTKTGKGTGLGLATVKQVVVELGAFIEMKSEPGKGTEFIIMFSESK
jgi:signal transduction histidine kinase